MYVSTNGGCNTGLVGLGGCGGNGSCSCGGNCGNSQFGLGLFDSMDFTTWGWGEWGAVLIGTYLVGSLIGDTGRARKQAKRTFKRRHIRQV